MDADHGMVDPAASLQSAGLEDGDNLTAIVIHPKVAATARAFALFCSGGNRVVTWGEPGYGGDSSEVQDQLKGVQQIQATYSAFAALVADGLVVTWGNPGYGGDSSEAQDQLKGVQQIQATGSALLRSLQMGQSWLGAIQIMAVTSLKSKINSRVSSRFKQLRRAFAAILADVSLVTWGDPDDGGDSFKIQDQLKGVQQVQATSGAFAAILADGLVVTWGDPDCGGDSSEVRDQLKGVRQVQATYSAFAAILADGLVVTWGNPDYGGDSSEVQDQLKGVQQVQATSGAFAAILADGLVVTWGDPDYGGDSSEVQDQLKGVQQVQATSSAFAAILADGSLVTWGDPDDGGDSSEVCCDPGGRVSCDLGQSRFWRWQLCNCWSVCICVITCAASMAQSGPWVQNLSVLWLALRSAFEKDRGLAHLVKLTDPCWKPWFYLVKSPNQLIRLNQVEYFCVFHLQPRFFGYYLLSWIGL